MTGTDIVVTVVVGIVAVIVAMVPISGDAPLRAS